MFGTRHIKEKESGSCDSVRGCRDLTFGDFHTIGNSPE